MDAIIRIKMDNAAFDGENGNELSRILQHCSNVVKNLSWHESDKLRLNDVNGNKVGYLTFEK